MPSHLTEPSSPHHLTTNPTPQDDYDSKEVDEKTAGEIKVAVEEAAEEDGEIDGVEEKRVLRKIDRVLMPVLMVTFFLQYIDKSALSYSAVFGLSKDLGLKGNEYATLGSLFYIGYLVAEFPASYGLQKLPMRLYVPTLVCLWGTVLACTSLGRSYAEFAACRFLLGITEAVITPAFLLLTSTFYKRAEQPFRAGLWYSCNGLGSLCGSLISYGMGQVHYKDHPVWAWIYIFCGCLTVLWGMCLFFLLPVSPTNAWFLNTRERLVAVERIRGNMSSLPTTVFKWEQVVEVFAFHRNPQGLLLLIFVIANEIVNGSAVFIKLVTQTYGFGTLNTILLGIPTGVMQMIFIISGTYLARRVPNMRIYTMMLYLLPSFTGIILQLALPRSARGGLLAGNYVLGSYVTSLVIGLSLPGSNSTGHTKKITFTAVVFFGYCIGNILGPQCFFAGESPPYKTGFIVCIIMQFVQFISLGLLRVWYVRENRRRDVLQAEREARGEVLQHDAFLDITDMQNLNFRYQI